MSLGPVFVQAPDGLWYKDPVMGVKGEWFICWDEDEPVELVIRAENRHDAERKLKSIKDLMRSHGARLNAECNWRISGRDFNDDGKCSFGTGYSCWVTATLVPALIRDPNCQTTEKPSCECTYYPYS